MGEVVVDMGAGTMRSRGVDLCQFDAVIVKKIAATYTPAAIDRLELLAYLEGQGVRVFSRPARMIPLIDRLSGTVKLQRGGIPMPVTVVTEDPGHAAAAVRRLGACVAKPLFSTKARGMQVLRGDDPELAAAVARFKEASGPVMYLQQLVDIPGRDLGVVFLGGEYLATYARVARAGAWNTTTAAGGRYEAHEPGPEVIELARRAQALFGLDFTCVDVVETADGPRVFEVSAFGGFRGLIEGCGVDAAARYVDHVIAALTREGRGEAREVARG